jgi:hypothetical protein
MKRNAMLLAAGAIAAGLIAAGCGGNDDSSSDTGTDAAALTKEEYLAQGNAICAQGNAELQQAGGADPANAAAFDAFVADTFVPNVQGQIDQLREGIPEGDEDTVNGFLDDAETILDEVEADPASIQGESDPFAEVNTQLEAYGLTACSG